MWRAWTGPTVAAVLEKGDDMRYGRLHVIATAAVALFALAGCGTSETGGRREASEPAGNGGNDLRLALERARAIERQIEDDASIPRRAGGA